MRYEFILTGKLNASDAENLLGYEIYSSALADILSEPGLMTPITMGLYAKWGSGKSFLLDKLRGGSYRAVRFGPKVGQIGPKLDK